MRQNPAMPISMRRRSATPALRILPIGSGARCTPRLEGCSDREAVDGADFAEGGEAVVEDVVGDLYPQPGREAREAGRLVDLQFPAPLVVVAEAELEVAAEGEFPPEGKVGEMLQEVVLRIVELVKV